MNSKTLKALKASIAHWRRFETNKRRLGERPYIDHCALCQLFYFVGCDGCPVKEKTRRPGCEGSPWTKADHAWSEYGGGSLEFMVAAKSEREFLESLLPKKGKKV